ncbi:DUF3899 domain-containing protein [Romboutsia maritimum]|uniref:DUF3899 domain-containing protein n=2 Tax=Romboutsia maritimum TaxID=2020948 RepID=A0A371IRG8_9FIRM|nr:DUF3899 domain-containing protein [Romboutsia maritimum]
MIYLLFGAFCFIWQKGFFDITIFSFNKLNQHVQKRNKISSFEQDISIEDYIGEKENFFLTSSLLISGMLISLTSITLSFFIIL